MNSILSRTLNLIVFTLVLLSSLYGCTLDAAAVRNQGVDECFSRVARMIDQQKELLMSESVAKELSEEELAVGHRHYLLLEHEHGAGEAHHGNDEAQRHREPQVDVP